MVVTCMQIFWVILGAALIVLELFTTSFFALFFGLGAIITASFYYLMSGSLSTQISVFILSSLLFLAIFRKAWKSKIEKNHSPMSSSIIGEIGIVISDIPSHALGRVKIRDVQWSASSKESLKAGQQVIVVSLSNLTVEVKPL